MFSPPRRLFFSSSDHCSLGTLPPTGFSGSSIVGNKARGKAWDRLEFPLVIRTPTCSVAFVPREKSTNQRNEDRKQEARMIRDFADKLIKDGKAKEFLVEHGFVKPNGGLTKRYGG